MMKATPNANREGVFVASTARLHLGFLDLSGMLGRRFGSIGMALDGPQTRLLLRRSDAPRVVGGERERAARYLDIVTRHLGIVAAHELTVVSAIPPHAGLGSGTQLALAVAAAVRRLHGLADDWSADAMRLGRASRSGIGVALFRDGGFVIDGGLGERGGTPPLLTRLVVPDSWRIVLVRDPRYRGLFGDDEAAAFAALPPFGVERARSLCHLVLMQLLPALAEDDLNCFGDAVSGVQKIVGDYFAPVQGGPVASPRVAAALSLLAAQGASGLGQSSWGPSGFAFIRGDAAAQSAFDLLRRSGDADGLEIEIRRPRNQGAVVTDQE
jgi:beta-ribofuranosylaminobenzene 5'-phosphate synthase